MNEQEDPALAGATPTGDISDFQKEAADRRQASPAEQASDVMGSEPGLGVESGLAEKLADDEGNE